MDKLILKFIWKFQRPRTAKAILKNESRVLIHLSFNTYYQVTVRFQGGSVQETHASPAVPWREKHSLLVTPEQRTSDQDRGGLTSLDCDPVALVPRPVSSPVGPQPRQQAHGSSGPLSFAGLVVGAFRGRADVLQPWTWGLARSELTCVVSTLAASTSALTFYSTRISE